MSHSVKTIVWRAVQQVRTHGMRLLWWRYVMRQRILRRPALSCPPDGDMEVHMQVCRRDWLNGHWTLRSFAHHAGKPFRLVLLHDGSLDDGALRHYRSLFPGVVIADRTTLAGPVEALLAEQAPALLEMWRSGRYFTLPKVVDSAVLAQAPAILQIDPDVLFFAKPDELLEASGSGGSTAMWNLPRDKGHADGMFCFDPALMQEASGLTPPVPFQVGLGLWRPDLMPWQAAERLLSRHAPPEHYIFMLDQTLLALHAAANGWQPLPRVRYVVEPVNTLDGVVARHYYGKTRDLMYVEGLPACGKP